eukprot:TRINITY_DN19715_c0_g1_i1.p1 TRINITY_DN19715_c0_g1~~TRINITY_DN19715_c0_g1_i1.p1  ORF type:complete len:397 (-),score=86.47 TRINITY_DN19715_c0_g1_i1:220-1410(-)
MTPLCALLASPHVWEISLLMEIVPPVIVVLFIARIFSSPSSWVWVVIVCHANLSFWAWISYFVSSHSCGGRERSSPGRGSNVFNTGIIFFSISGIICLIAALANDQYFPIARLTVREAKAFLDHLRTCRPSKKVTLSSLYSMEGRDHVKAVYPVASWEDSSEFPDLTTVASQGDMAVKITLTATAYDEATEEDFDSFLERFTSNNGVDQNSADVKIITSIVGGRTQLGSGRRTWKVFPTVRSDQTCRIYIYSSQKPLLMEFFLRTAWIFNILAVSGPVLATFMSLKNRTQECKLIKTYKSFSSRPLPSCLSTSPPARPIIISNQSVSHRTSPTDLSSIVPSLITYQILHRPASQVSPSPVLSQVSPIQEINMKDLPPSYSVLDLHSELPSYYEATK